MKRKADENIVVNDEYRKSEENGLKELNKLDSKEYNEAKQWMINEIKRMIKKTESPYVFGDVESMLYNSVKKSCLNNKTNKSIKRAIQRFQTDAIFIIEGASLTDAQIALINEDIAVEIKEHFND